MERKTKAALGKMSKEDLIDLLSDIDTELMEIEEFLINLDESMSNLYFDKDHLKAFVADEKAKVLLNLAKEMTPTLKAIIKSVEKQAVQLEKYAELVDEVMRNVNRESGNHDQLKCRKCGATLQNKGGLVS